MEIKELGLNEWEEILPKDGFDVFHSTEALQLLDKHTSGEMVLLGGFKGQQPVGLVPIFVRQRKIGRLITSPPLGYGIVRLGPLVMPTSPKPRKRESVNKKFVQKVVEYTGADANSTIFRTVCDPRYVDPRPFQWVGLNVTPSFTYQIDLESTSPDQVLQSFSSDRRKEIRNRNKARISVRRGGVTEANNVYESIQARYQEQDLKVPYEREFIRDVVDTFDERIRVYTAESPDGEFISGILVLYSNDTAYNWKGGTKITERDFSISPNSLLHWKIIEDILEDPDLASIERYDMYTANEERLSGYKSSFGGKLTTFYTIESSGLSLKVAKGIYRMSAHGKLPLGEKPINPWARYGDF